MLLSSHHASSYQARTHGRHSSRGLLLVQASAEPPGPTAPRRNISQRIEQLRKQNEQLKQAIGVFLDRPEAGDVGVVTGKPTGAWNGDSTATLLDTLRKRGSDSDAEAAFQAAASPSGSPSESQEEVTASIDAEPEQPVGPVFSTSLSTPPQSNGASSSRSSIETAAVQAAAADGWPQPAVAASEAAADGWLQAPPAAEQAAADGWLQAPPAAEQAAAAEYSSSSNSSRSISSNPWQVISAAAPPAAASAAAAAQPAAATAAAAAPAVAPPPAPPKPPVLGKMHERVEQMEREAKQQQQKQKAYGKQAPAVKPRATARRPPPSCSMPLDIVFASAEVAPWSKTGGLGDVMGALPRAMAARGHRVMVVAPRYTNGGKDIAKYKDTKPVAKSVWAELNNSWHELKYHTVARDGVDYVFIEHMCYQREGTPYGDTRGPFADNLFRFALLSLGALEAPLNLPIKRDLQTGEPLNEVYGQDVLFVANDWHAALLPLLLTARFRPYGVYANARCCLAIHNLAHQGSYEAGRFNDIGLSGDWYGALEWQDPADKQRKKTINVLKAGIVTSDLLLTVSQGYAAEITGMPQDARVDMLLAQRANKLRGIVNGIDVAEWDPETDKHLVKTYSPYDLAGKAACKRALQREMRLPLEPDMPLIGFIGRLDYQKGPDLLLDALPTLGNLDCQVVMLGSGAADYEERVREANHEYGWFCKGHVGFSVPLSHKIIAGCDMLIMPSRFEPCGLNQMYAMRYGTVPIAHATGGLIDTIQDYNPFAKGDGEGTGWTFAPAAVEPMVAAVSTAVKVFREEQERWRALQLRCMFNECSWEHAAQQYEGVLCEVMADAVQYSRK